MTARARTWVAYGLVLAVPELWITTLYFNTTALGLPFFAGTLAMLSPQSSGQEPARWHSVVAGAMFAVACLLRFDFAAAAPALLAVVYFRSPHPKPRAVLVFAGGAAVTGCLILLALRVNPLQLMAIAGGLRTHPWTAWRSAVVFGLAALPLIAISPFLAFELRRRNWRPLPLTRWVPIAILLLPLIYPLTSLYSGKYLVPAFCMALFALAWLLGQPVRGEECSGVTLSSNLRWVTLACSGAILVAVYLFGVQVDRKTWGVSGIGWTASTFGTHDGVRPLAGYLGWLAIPRDPKQRNSGLLFHQNLAEWILRAPDDSIIVLLDNVEYEEREKHAVLVEEWSWGFPALYLYGQGWRLDSYVMKQRIAMHARDGRRAEIVAEKNAPDAVPSHPCFIIVGAEREGNTGYEEVKRYADAVATAPCNPIEAF